jgi:DNA-nicking Smr family endonuclease
MTRSGDNGVPMGSGEDADLWHHVTQSVHPLRRRDRTVPAAATTAPPVPRPGPATMDPRPPAAPDQRRWQPLVTTPHPKPPTAARPSDTFERRKAKKIARGHIAIEGRIDLHGLTENEAHHRLRAFLRQAQAQDKRIVLVITGKGRNDDDPTAPFDFGMGAGRRGVLKRNVPRWLAEPDLAQIVVSFSAAHIRHGGEGALYVHLRQRRS